jgi:hypothetical protein
MISFWRLTDIGEDYREHPPKHHEYFNFGDWSIDCCLYAMRLKGERTGTVHLFCDEKAVIVARSFEEFVDAYLRNDERVLYGKGLGPESFAV